MTVNEYYIQQIASLKSEMLTTKVTVILELIKTMDIDEISELEEEIKTYIENLI